MINAIVIYGKLINNPSLREIAESHVPYAYFILEMSNGGDNVMYIPCMVSNNCEAVMKYCAAGSHITITGKIKTWKNKEGYSCCIIGKDIQFHDFVKMNNSRNVKETIRDTNNMNKNSSTSENTETQDFMGKKLSADNKISDLFDDYYNNGGIYNDADTNE